MITFEIPLEAVGQPRYTVGKGKKHFIHKSHPIHAFKDAVRLFCPIKRPRSGKHLVGIVCYFQRPKKDKHIESPEYTGTPDADNIFKAVTDALNELAWPDDRQCDIDFVRRYWCERGERPRTVVHISKVLLPTA